MRGGFVVCFMILSHRLSPEAFAQLSYFHLTLGYVAAFSMLGLSVTTVRTFASASSSRQGHEGGAELAIFLAIAMIASISAWLWGKPQITGLPNYTFALVLPLLIIGAFSQGVLNGREEFRAMALVAIVASGVMVGCSVLASGGQALLLAFAGLAGAYLVKLLGEGTMALRALRQAHIQIRKPAVGELRKILAAMSWLGVASITNAFGMWGLTSWMRTQLDDSSFGTFAVGIQWYAIGMFLAANITRVLMPLQVQMATAGRDAKSKLRVIVIGGAAAIAVAMVAALSAFLFRGVIAGLYDTRLPDLAYAIVAFTAAAATVSPLNIIGNYAVAEGKERLWTISSLAWLGFAVVAGLVLKNWGSIGGAGVIAIANIGQAVTILSLLRRRGML
jgi:O-antigen/teichoic acid export membrane protein